MRDTGKEEHDKAHYNNEHEREYTKLYILYIIMYALISYIALVEKKSAPASFQA